MKEKVFVKDLIPDTFIDSPFLLKTYQVRQKKNGEDYLSFVFCDKTGELDGVMWEGIDSARNEISEGDFVQVSGKVSTYQGRQQMTVQRIVRLSDKDVNEEEYFPSTDKNRSEMWNDLMSIINAVGNLHLRRLLLDIFADDDIADKFQKAPAARGNHHTFIGGLLEHTLSIVQLCEKIADHYPELIDKDLLITGGLIHDLEKIHELSYDRNFDYTEEGRLIGHIVMGAIDLDKRMKEQEFPEKLRLKVLHMLISHHGELEFGSPKVPMTAEALALHYIDMIDSRMEMIRMEFERTTEEESVFTPYHRGLQRYFYKG